MRTILALIVFGLAPSLWAHCDSLNGPVVSAARQALAKGDVTVVLKWVQPADEKEIRDAFAQTMKVRAQSPEAKTLADRWFFETLVRVHRAGEGAPFTGLQPAGYQPEKGIALADEAIDSGSLDEAEKAVLSEIRTGLRTRFLEVIEAKEHANENLEAGRRFVHAYVEFIHYVERLDEDATSAAGHHAAVAHPAESR